MNIREIYIKKLASLINLRYDGIKFIEKLE